jgi:hypothetical protein
MLDNQRMAMVEDADARSLHPLFVIDDSGIARYGDRPQLANAPLPAEPLTASRSLIAIAE